MNNQPLKNITLPMGASFSECGQSISGEWKDCSNLGSINNSNGYTGEFRMAPHGKNVAAFASPDFASCDGPPVDKKNCIIELKFNQDQVEWLRDNQVIESLLHPPLVIPPNPAPSATSVPSKEIASGDVKTTTEQPECTSPFNCSLAFVAEYWLPLFSSLVVLLLLLLFKDHLHRLIFADNRQNSSNQAPRSTSSPSPLPTISVGSLESSTTNHRLNSISNQLQSVISRLNEMEIRLLDLEQRSLSKTSRVFSNESSDLMQSSGILENLPLSTVSVSKPLPLSIDLIKQAVAQMDYSLIATHSHLFLNETQESRQGKLERKRFDVLGDQSQSSSFANAEFIAIPVGSQTFLIPNILPNAADPRRTMKRHVDSNSIYRAGAGSNILKIDTLATLQQLSTASYELAGLGSIE